MGNKADRLSIRAKHYINSQVNSMKKKIKEAPDEVTKKALIDTFKTTVSSNEYQGNLRIVQEDSEQIRKSLEPWERNADNFKKSQEDFYGKLKLYFDEEELKEFYKKDEYEKIDILFKKFGDGDQTLSMILYLFDNVDRSGDRSDNRNRDPLDRRGYYERDDPNYREMRDARQKYKKWMMNVGYNSKFHNLGVDVARELIHYGIPSSFGFLLFADPNAFSDDVWNDPQVINYIGESILYDGGYKEDYPDWTKKLDIVFNKIGKANLQSMKPVNVARPSIIGMKMLFKYFDDCGLEKFDEDIITYLINTVAAHDSSNLWCGSDVQSFMLWLGNHEKSKAYHKIFADAFMDAGYSYVIKNNIDKLNGLTEEQKDEILGKDILRENFYNDLAELRKLGKKLGITIKVEEQEEQSVNKPQEVALNDEELGGNKKRKRRLFGKNGKVSI